MRGIGLKLLLSFLPPFSLPSPLRGGGGTSGGRPRSPEPGFDLRKWEERVKMASISSSRGGRRWGEGTPVGWGWGRNV